MSSAKLRVRGFALVGVVMFVLVLTILALSLFSLSSFESQFFTQSLSRLESFNAASGGIERARFVLAATETLQAVQANVVGGLIVSAEARQGNIDFESARSTGAVDWDGQGGLPPADVWIRVVAQQRGQRSKLEARFRPERPADYYRRLMTLSGELTVVGTFPQSPGGPGPALPRTTLLTGEIWKNGENPVTAGGLFTLRPGGGVATPNLTTHLSGSVWATALEVVDSGGEHWSLEASGVPFRYFKTPSNGAEYSINSQLPSPLVTVSGTAVWLLDRGIRADYQVRVEGSPGSALVIVAGKTSDTSPQDLNRGFNLLGSIASTIPLVLVTDGTCGIEHKNNSVFGQGLLPLVSIYAHDAWLMGPALPGSLLMVYPPAALDPIVDVLYELRILPNSSAGVAKHLDPIAGTWRDITESDPS